MIAVSSLASPVRPVSAPGIMLPVDVGSWADWVNAVGTYLAVAGAAFAGAVALRSYRVQQASTIRQVAEYVKEEKRRLQTERQAQAATVAVWVFRGRSRWHVYRANGSDLPIFRVTVYFECATHAISTAVERGTQGPSNAQESTKLTNALYYILNRANSLDADPDEIRVEIAFTDAAGIRWCRRADGMLDEVPKDFDFEQASERLVDRLVPDGDERETGGGGSSPEH